MNVDDFLAGQMVTVPAGNLNDSAKGYDDSKFRNVLWILGKADKICVIKYAAEIYQIDPVSIIGSIVGEHTYNVDAWDITQDTYAYMVSKWINRFEGNSIDLASMLEEPEYSQCPQAWDRQYDIWNCYNNVWRQDTRNPKPGSDLKWTFFNPMGSGFTYGLGQLGPERALMVTDIVAAYSGFELLTVTNPPLIYDSILNPEKSIHYTAASNLIAIETYKYYAQFDISQNVGIIATLYNLGKEQEKAVRLYDKTVDSLSKNGRAKFPEVNYYGWFVNSKEAELREFYSESVQKANCQ